MGKLFGYMAISDDLRRRIQSGEFAPGSVLPSESQLCSEWNVERTTVRRAMSILVAEGLVAKRAGFGSIVKAPLPDTSPLINFIRTSPTGEPHSGTFSHHFIEPVYESFARICGEAGYRSVESHIAGANRLQTFSSIVDSSTAVVLVDFVPDGFLQTVHDKKIPCILMSERAIGFRSVLCDNDSGLSQAVQHLAQLGHTEIAFLGGDGEFLNSRARVDGFRRAMFASGLYERKPSSYLCGWSIRDGYNGFMQLMKEHPNTTAVCTVSDKVAVGVHQAACEMGYRVPQDFSIIGFGDSLDREISRIPLSTVRISTERFARELFFALEREMKDPYANPGAVLVEAELIVRNTTESRQGAEVDTLSQN